LLQSNRLSKDPQLRKAAENQPPLTKGLQGTGVAELQDLLADLGYFLSKSFGKGRADGIYGIETESAVRQFQKDQKLKPDGIAGRMTLARLDDIVLADKRHEVPSIADMTAADLSDRSRTIYTRSKAHW
jgi:peptidoglycan hydrolase-like protein with peptidoglycan-binding domain